MTESTGPIHDVVSDHLLELLRDASSGSSDFVEVILDTPGIGGRFGGVDGRATLIEIMRTLVVLTGSEEAAVDWLFNSRGFTAAVGDDAYLALENGDFWSLTVMNDWLKILVKHRLDCSVLIDAVFGQSAP
jgi:hypothetical protein